VTSTASERSRSLTRDDVVDAALRIVEAYGADGLTMRRLADELGAAVTAIYWHAGNRDALLDLLVDRIVDEMGHIGAAGRTPHARIASLARTLRRKLLARPHLIGLAHERARTAALFQPVQAALARELAKVGLHGTDAALAIRVLQCHVVASVVLERTTSRGPTRETTDVTLWPENQDDPDLVRGLAGEVDFTEVFEYGLKALLATLPAADRR
jgi:TetR/AcrR family transcriptional regulator, tetracycline repressor protein